MKFLLCAAALSMMATSQVITSLAPTVTFSSQLSPSPLPKSVVLYSVEIYSPTARTISAAQIRQAAESLGIDYQEPVNVAVPLPKSTTRLTKLLTASKYISGGGTVASGTIAALKSSGSAPGNAQTWDIVAAATAAFATGAALAQSQFQSAVSAAATTTTGVSGALMDSTALYSIAAGGGLPKTVMLYGIGPTGTLKGVL